MATLLVPEMPKLPRIQLASLCAFLNNFLKPCLIIVGGDFMTSRTVGLLYIAPKMEEQKLAQDGEEALLH